MSEFRCVVCDRHPVDNDDVFFDVATTVDGKNGKPRVDEVVCGDCIAEWIADRGVAIINLIRRVENPVFC